VQIGAFGHSQGATGAFNAMLKSGGKIKTVLPLELPAQFLCSNQANCADTTKMSSGSIFLVDGSADLIIFTPDSVSVGDR
jgi:predicted esterase